MNLNKTTDYYINDESAHSASPIKGTHIDLIGYRIDKDAPDLFQFCINNYYTVNDITLLCVKTLAFYAILFDEKENRYIVFDQRATTFDGFDDLGAPVGAKYLKTDTDGHIRVDFIKHTGFKESMDDFW